MAISPVSSEKLVVPQAEDLIGKRIVVTNPPAKEEIIIQVVPDDEAKPEEDKIAPGAPLVKFLQGKAIGGEFDFVANRTTNTLPIRYRIVRIEDGGES